MSFAPGGYSIELLDFGGSSHDENQATPVMSSPSQWVERKSTHDGQK